MRFYIVLETMICENVPLFITIIKKILYRLISALYFYHQENWSFKNKVNSIYHLLVLRTDKGSKFCFGFGKKTSSLNMATERPRVVVDILVSKSRHHSNVVCTIHWSNTVTNRYYVEQCWLCNPSSAITLSKYECR